MATRLTLLNVLSCLSRDCLSESQADIYQVYGNVLHIILGTLQYLSKLYGSTF